MAATIPFNLTRVPNSLRSQLLLSNIGRTNLDLLRIQSQLASGYAVTSFADDPVAASAISVIQQRLATGNQLARNLDNADRTLTYLDSTLGDTLTLAQDAKTLASGQIGGTSDAQTRANQAVVVEGAIRQLFLLGNRSTNEVYVFGGATATQAPLEDLQGGFRYRGRGNGLYSELGAAADVPITIGGQNAVGETAVRVRSRVDFSPVLTSSTRLSDVYGARRLGISPGAVELQFNAGPKLTVDLSRADTAGDIVTQLTAAIRTYETDNAVSILGPGGVSLSGGAFNIDVVAGTPSNPTLTFRDLGVGSTAQDLGLTAVAFSDTTSVGSDIDPKLTQLTPLSALSGITLPLGTVRFRFSSGTGTTSAQRLADIDLSSAQTIDDVRNLIETGVPGVRVNINSAGNSLDVVNEIAGPSLSIESGPGSPDTATQFGIRTALLSTSIRDFNDGRGIDIIGSTPDPLTGAPSRAYSTDFRVFLGNGQAFDVDLRPEDLADIQTLLARINTEFTAAISQPPVVSNVPALSAGQFSATLGPKGIQFSQTGITGGITVGKLNNSPSAEDLGLLNGSYDATSATFTAQDRTSVRINNNLFSALIRLRDSLRANDSNGIALAGQELDGSISRLSETQALVGVYSNRVTKAQDRQEDEGTTSEAQIPVPHQQRNTSG